MNLQVAKCTHNATVLVCTLCSLMPRVGLQFVNDFFGRSLDKSCTTDDFKAKRWKRRSFLHNEHITAEVKETTLHKQDKDELFPYCQQTPHSHANIHDWRVLIGKKSELIMNRQAILKFEASLLFNTLQILHTHTQTHIEREREGGGARKIKQTSSQNSRKQ